LEPLTALIAPFAPHIAEELWHAMGHDTTVCDAKFPEFNPEYLVENSFEYPVMINGKLRFKQEYALDMEQNAIAEHIVTTEGAQKWLEGKAPKKIIVVKGKIINIVM
jgi:leucyl-tRNA synthetase